MSWLLRWMRLQGTKPAVLEGPEATLRELAVLLGAGLSPTRAWEEVAILHGSGSVPKEIQEQKSAGYSLADSIEQVSRRHSSWALLGACWEVARVSGAPLGPALRSLADGLQDQERTIREVDAEMAAPRATLRLVGLLPLLAVGGGALAGVNALAFFFLNLWGFISLLVGLSLLGLAWWWMRLLVGGVISARVPPSPRGDLFVVALGGGIGPERALRSVDAVLQKFSLATPTDDELERVIALSRRAGVPVAGLVRSKVNHLRDLQRTEATRMVGDLSVRLVVPLGLLVLPAFVLIAVFPMAWGLWNEGVAL